MRCGGGGAGCGARSGCRDRAVVLLCASLRPPQGGPISSFTELSKPGLGPVPPQAASGQAFDDALRLDRALPQSVGIQQVGGQGQRGGPVGPVVQVAGCRGQRAGNSGPAPARADVLEASCLDQAAGEGRDPQGEGVVAGPLSPEVDQIGCEVLVDIVAHGLAGAQVDGQRPAAQGGQQLVGRRGQQQEVPGRPVGRLLKGLEQHVRSGRMQRLRFDDDEHLAPGLEWRHLGRPQEGSDLVDGDDRLPLLRVAAHEHEVGMEDLVGLEVDPPAMPAGAAGALFRRPFAQQCPGDLVGKGKPLLRLAPVEDHRWIQPARGSEFG